MTLLKVETYYTQRPYHKDALVGFISQVSMITPAQIADKSMLVEM